MARTSRVLLRIGLTVDAIAGKAGFEIAEATGCADDFADKPLFLADAGLALTVAAFLHGTAGVAAGAPGDAFDFFGVCFAFGIISSYKKKTEDRSCISPASSSPKPGKQIWRRVKNTNLQKLFHALFTNA